MKKIVCVIIAILVIAAMSGKALAAGNTVYPEGGSDTAFDGETRDKDVNVSFANKSGDPVEPGDWDVQDGYAVDINWGGMKFLYKLNEDDPEDRYVSVWDPDALKWIIWDTDEDKEVTRLDGSYDEDNFTSFSGKAYKIVTNTTTDPVYDKYLGDNGFVVTNRSSQPIDVKYSYTQTLPLYSNPTGALASAGGKIDAVYGQVDDTNTSEAKLCSFYSFLTKPDVAPTSQGICGTVTIAIN